MHVVGSSIIVTYQFCYYCYHRNTGENPKLLDDKERQHRLESRQKKIKEYRIARQEMLQVRNQDREARNIAKLKQLEMAAEWQVWQQYNNNY